MTPMHGERFSLDDNTTLAGGLETCGA